MVKSFLRNALDHLKGRKPSQSGNNPLLFEELESRVLYSAAPVDVSDGTEQRVEETIEVASASWSADAPSAANPGSLTNALQAPDIHVIDCLQTDALSLSSSATSGQVERLANAAVQRWDATGLTQPQRDALASIRYEIRDLGGLTVAYTEGSTIVIDDDAGGRGWFLDFTPEDDAEFAPGSAATSLRANSLEAQTGIDLLTTLMHEQGHVLGLPDAYLAGDLGNLMYGGVDEGARALPSTGQAAGAIPGSLAVRAPATLTVDTFSDVVNASDGVLSLREALMQAVTGDTIVLGAGTYSIQLTTINEDANAGGDFDISGKTITIQGAGIDSTVVDGNNIDRVFHVTGGANVAFKDLTITGGKLNYGHGAGMQVDGTTTVVNLENVKIDGNRVETPNTSNIDRYGGGIRVNNATVTGVNVQITNNLATRVGSGRYPLGGGIMLDGTAKLTLTDSVISNNTSTHSSGGGAYVAYGSTLNLYGVTMEGNKALNGGGIFGAYGATINIANSASTQSALTGNMAYSSDYGSNTATYGGAIRVDGSTLTITGDTTLGDVLIQNNSSMVTNYGTSGFQASYAGGLSIRTEAQVTLDRVTISGNFANRSDNAGGEGGGLFIEQTGTVVNATHVTITGNTARVRGGGFRVGNPGAVFTLTDSVISNNTAQNEYGGGFYNHGTVNLINTDIQGNITLDWDNSNRRDGHGGGFYNGLAGIVNFDANSDVRSNSAWGYGGGGMNEGGTINANGNTWELNTTIYNNSGRNGGALWNYLGGVANLESVIFQDNATGSSATQIEGSGGAILNSDQAILNISGASVFQRNLSASGGAISTYSNGSIVNITGTAAVNVLIQDNWTRGDGGGLRQDNELSQLNLQYVTIRNNIAENSDGGGIANQNGIIRADHVTITNNAAGTANDHDGGGLYLVNRSDVLVTNSVISNNVAYDDGGGAFVTTAVRVRLENTIVSGNKSGINHKSSSGYTAGTNTVGNITVLGDAATASNNPDTTNANEGGAFYILGNGTTEFINCSVVNNIADDSGGGIHAWDESNLVVTNCLIAGNRAGFNAAGTAFTQWDRHGGGIRLGARAKITITDSAILANEVSGDGAGLAAQDDAAFTIVRSTLADNVAAFGGGAVHSLSGNNRGSIVNSTLSGNFAGYKRAANGGTLAVEDRTETDGDGNTNSRGGAIYHENGITNVIHSTIAFNTAENSAAADAGGGIRRNAGTINLTASVLTQNVETTAGTGAANEYRGTVNLVDSYAGTTGATLNALSDAFQVGAQNAGGDGLSSSLGQVQVHLPDVGATNIVDAVTTAVLASDQLGAGRGGSAGASDRGAVERNALASAITIDSVTLPATWISGTSLEADAAASSLGSGGGTLRFTWTVTGGTSSVPATEHDVAAPGAGETDSFSFTHTIASADISSETLTVTLTVTDLSTSQTVTETRAVRILNPDALPSAPVGTIQVTTASDVIDSGDAQTSLREAITAANSSAAGDYVITFAAGVNPVTALTAVDDSNAGGDFDISKSNGAVFLVGNGLANTVIDGGGIDRVFDLRPNATVFFKDLTITGGNTDGVASNSDHGAGFRAQGASVVLTNVSITGNQSIRGTGNVGGGFFATNSGLVGSTIFMKGGSITSNRAGASGGGWYANGTSASTTAVFMEDVTIAGNISLNEALPIEDQDGGGFLFTGQRNVLRLRNVTISDNSARDDGGGFAISGENQSVLFDNVTIQRNAVEGATQDTDLGTSFNAVTFNNQTTQVYYGTTSGESARDGGGGVIDATNSTITFLGGLIGGDRDSVTGKILDGNYADNEGAGLMIRGLVTVNFDGTVIRGNFAEDSGAGLCIDGPATVTFANGEIRENYSIGEHGGGLRAGSATVTITNSALTANFAGDRLYLADPGNLVGGAIYATNAAQMKLVDVSITGNQAEGRGGAIFASRASVIDISSSITGTKTTQISGNNSVESGTSEGGGAIFVTDAGTVLRVTDAVFDNNRTGDDGGAFFIQGPALVSLTRVDVTGNEAQNSGGGIFLESDQARLTLEDVLISGNATRAGSGGGILTNGSVTANNVIISGNRTRWDLDTTSEPGSATQDLVGGGMYVAGAEASFTGTNIVIAGNRSFGRGGGVFISDGKLDLTNFILRDNQTNSDGDINRGRGGGVYGESIITLLLTNGEISGNRAEGHGGGIYQGSDGSRTVLTNVTVSGNTAGYDPDTGAVANRAADGGGIQLSENSILILDQVTLTQNQATQNGGGVNRGGGFITYRNSILFGNLRDAEAAVPFDSDNNASATIEGVVIIGYNQGGTLTTTNGTRIFSDPLLAALTDNGGPTLPGGYRMWSHSLNHGSPAVDAAVASLQTVDQRGATRAIGAAPDLGAIEISQPALGTVTFDNTSVLDGLPVTITGDILYPLNSLDLQRGVTVEVDWGDGTPFSRMAFAPNHDFSAGSPDFTFTHTYGTGLTGNHTASVRLNFTGANPVLDSVSQVISVTERTAQSGQTGEDSAVTLGTPGVAPAGELKLDDETIIPDLNRLGWAVDIDGDWAVIGAEGQGHREEVSIYHKTAGGTWVLEQTLVNDTTDIFDDFGYAVNVDAANGRIFVGAQLDDSGNTDRGAVYYYQFDGTQAVGSQWILRQSIKSVTGTNDADQFGSSLDSSGDVLVVGALAEDTGGTDAGAVFVFNYNSANNQYVLAQKLQAQLPGGSADVAASDNFGRSVAIDGNRLVVGAELNDDTGSNSGSAYVFKFDAGQAVGSQWVIEAKLAASNQGADDRFGFDVDIAGGIVAVGARQEDIGGGDRGGVYIYNFEGSTVGAVLGAADTDRVRVITTNTLDAISVSYVNAGANQTLAVSETTPGVVQVRLATNSSGVITSTATQVAAALNNFALTSPHGGTLQATATSHGTGAGVVVASASPVPLQVGYELTEVSGVTAALGSADGDRLGGSVALDEVGGTIRLLTAAYQNDAVGGVSDVGRGYLFELDLITGLFELKQDLRPVDVNGTIARDEFGLSLAISGDDYLIGARLADAYFTTSDGAVIELGQFGAAYVFSGTPGIATQTAKLDGDLASRPEIGGAVEFGRRVAVAGDFVLVGAPQAGKEIANNTDQQTGRAYLFHRNDQGTISTEDDTWSLVATLAPPTTDDDAGDNFGYGVAISANTSTIAIGALSHEASGADQGAVYVYTFDQATGSVTLQGRIRAANRSDSDEFGRQVTLNEDGSILAVGMRLDDDLDSNSGSVHVYTASGGDWDAFFAAKSISEQSIRSVNDDGIKLKPISDATDVESDEFGRTLAISGNRLVVGALDDDYPVDDNNDTASRDLGAVYVFQYDAAGSHTVLDLDASGGNGKAQIALSSTVTSGVTVQITTGGSGAQPTVSEVGNAITVQLGSAGNTASEIVAAINSAGLTTNLSATLFLGNSGVINDGAGIVTSAAGSVTLTQWELQQKLRASNLGKDDLFGISVDISGDTLIVGANQEDSNSATTDNNSASNSGCVYVFEFNGSNPAGSQWTQVQRLKASDLQADDHFGRAVAIDGDLIVVGAYLEDSSGSESGAAYVFQRNSAAPAGSQWTQYEAPIRSPYGLSRDQFGLSVAISEGTIIVGANQQDHVLSDGTIVANFGAVYAYQVQTAASISAVTQPAKGVVTTDGSTITFHPNGLFDALGEGETEPVTFTYTLAGGQVVQTTITIQGSNDSPRAVVDSVTVSEDSSASGNLLGNDTDDDAGASLSVGSVNGTATQVGSPIVLASGAIVTVQADGTYTFDPNGAYETLSAGETATETLTYRVTDGSGQFVYQEVDGAFVGEARDYSSTSPGWLLRDQALSNPDSMNDSRTGEFMQVPDAAGVSIVAPSLTNPAGKPALTFQVEIETPGTYELYVRAAGFDGGSDSLYATILEQADGVTGGNPDWFVMNVAGGRAFTWASTGTAEVGTMGTAAPVQFNLGTGLHTIMISPREDGVAVDAFMLRRTDSSVAAPTGTESGPQAQQDATVTFTIQGVNDAPAIQSAAAITLAENSTAVVDVQAVDPEGLIEGSGLTYSIVGGADQARFALDPNSGVLSFMSAPDYEQPASAGGLNLYDLRIQVTDGVNLVTQDLAVTVTNVNEAPAPAGDTVSLPSTSANGTVVHTVLPNDPDAGDSHAFAIGGGDPGHVFAIDASGRIVVNDAAQLSGGQTYNLTVQVTDQSGTGLMGEALVTIQVTAVDQPPTGVTLQNPVLAADEGSDTTGLLKVADILITDDGAGTNVLSLAGVDSAKFLVSGTELFFQDGVLDSDRQTTYSVTLNVDGIGVGSAVDASAVFIFSVTNVAPTAQITGATDGTAGTPVILTGSGSDPGPADETLDYSWSVSKNGASGFASGTGSAISFTPDAGGTYVVSLIATDPAGLSSATATHTVTVPTSGPTAWINEIHYDNSGIDSGEFVEVAGVAGTSLSGWSIVLYNGANGQYYATINLSGTIDNEGGTGYGALSFLRSGIQDGAPDGLALVDASGTVVEFLSYEGTFAAINGPAAGMVSTGIGVSESASPVGQSLQRDNTSVGSPGAWYGPVASSSGYLNGGAPAMFAIAASAAVKPEGDAGTTPFTFTVTRSGNTSGSATIDYTVTANGVNAADFAAGSLPAGTVNFADGESTTTLTILVQGDSTVEADEGFTVTLSNPSTGTITTASASATIQNDDTSFAISPLSAAKGEGQTGTTAFTFTVTRSGSSSAAATVDYAVSGGGVDSPDFAGSILPSGTVNFAAGETSRTLTILVQGDTDAEPDENFTVTLSNPSSGTVSQALATGTIQNDDTSFAIAPLAATQAEGNAGTVAFTFTVTRSGIASSAATINYAVSGSAITPSDFAGGVLPSGTVNFAPGETSKVLTILVQGDTAAELDEAFSVSLSNASSGTITQALATGTIQNDDTGFAIAALDAARAEGDSGATWLTFTVTRFGSIAGTATVDYAVSGSGIDPSDFVGGILPSGTVDFAAGETSKTLTVQVQGDTEVELDESFTVTLTNPSTGTIAQDSAMGMIQNDDTSFAITGLDAMKPEGDSGTTPLTFLVTREGKVDGSATVDFSVSGAAAADYAGGVFPSGTLNFADGETSKSLTIQVAGDRRVESNEAFSVTLSNPSHGVIASAPAQGMIQNDDAPGVVVDHAGAVLNVTEGDQLTLQVSLLGIPEHEVIIAVTASPGVIDLGAGVGTPAYLHFSPLNADVPQQLTVTVPDDATDSGTRLVTVHFLAQSTATGYGGLSTQPVTVQIADNDPFAPIAGIEGYSQTSFDLGNPTFGMPPAPAFSFFAGFLPASVFSQPVSSSPLASGVIQPDLPSLRSGIEWTQPHLPVLAGYSEPQGPVRFTYLDAEGRVLSSGSGFANEQGAFLILEHLSGGIILRLEFTNPEGTVETLSLPMT